MHRVSHRFGLCQDLLARMMRRAYLADFSSRENLPKDKDHAPCFVRGLGSEFD